LLFVGGVIAFANIYTDLELLPENLFINTSQNDKTQFARASHRFFTKLSLKNKVVKQLKKHFSCSNLLCGVNGLCKILCIFLKFYDKSEQIASPPTPTFNTV
jgi:hypothetical protein